MPTHHLFKDIVTYTMSITGRHLTAENWGVGWKEDGICIILVYATMHVVNIIIYIYIYIFLNSLQCVICIVLYLLFKLLKYPKGYSHRYGGAETYVGRGVHMIW